MNEYCINALYSGFQGDFLCHYGKEGMRWGFRRYQPYSQGYDAQHQGREIGLAARLGGHGSNYSSMYARKTITDRARSAASRFGKKLHAATQETADKLNRGLDRAEKKAREATDRARQSFESYMQRRGKRAPVRYDAETNNVLVRRASQLGGRETKLNQTSARIRSELMRRGLGRIREKERQGIYKTHFDGKSLSSDVHDWFDELTSDERKTLTSIDRLRDKASAKAALASRKAFDYSTGLHEQSRNKAQKTRDELYAALFESTERAKQMSLQLRAKVSDVARYELQRQQIDADARRRLDSLRQTRLSEALSSDVSEDYKVVREFLKQMMG